MPLIPTIPNGGSGLPEGWYETAQISLHDYDDWFSKAWVHKSASLIVGYQENPLTGGTFNVHVWRLGDIREDGKPVWEDAFIAPFVNEKSATRRCIQEMMILNNVSERC